MATRSSNARRTRRIAAGRHAYVEHDRAPRDRFGLFMWGFCATLLVACLMILFGVWPFNVPAAPSTAGTAQPAATYSPMANRSVPTAVPYNDRGSDASSMQPDTINLRPADPTLPVQAAAEQAVHDAAAAIGFTGSPDQTALPACSDVGHAPCQFTASGGIAASSPVPVNALGGINGGTDANRQKDDLPASATPVPMNALGGVNGGTDANPQKDEP